MTPNLEAELRRRIAELEQENARLRQTLEWVKEERKELRDIVCARLPEPPPLDEDELVEMVKNHVPGSGRRFFEELGILPPTTP